MSDEPGLAGDDDDNGITSECLLCEVGGIRHYHGSEIVEW